MKEHSNNCFYTIGHSTRTFNEFVDILKKLNIDCVVDVRTVPNSRTNPQYNYDTLPELLEPFNIKYEHIAKLGGFRSKRKDLITNPDANAFWEKNSFRNYADYAMSNDFLDALKELIELGKKNRCVIMCAEVLWWRCHRRIITDYLLAAKEKVQHIISINNISPAKMTDSAKIIKETGFIKYPKPT